MNNLLVISGPSGSGKSTLIQRLLKKNDDLFFSLSHTTRPARDNEINGRDYYFVSRNEFESKIKADAFAEWAEVHGHFYGTSHEEINNKSTGNKILIMDIDVQGARSIHKAYSQAVLVFVVPPSLRELRRRLVSREKREDDEIEARLKIAHRELKEYPMYDFVIFNNQIDDAFVTLEAVYHAFKMLVWRNREKIESLIGEEV